MVTLPRHRPRQGSATARINKRKMPDDPTSVRRSVGADNGSLRELLGDPVLPVVVRSGGNNSRQINLQNEIWG